MSKFMVRLGLVVGFLVTGANAALAIQGVVLYKAPAGEFQKQLAELQIPNKWPGDVILKVGETNLKASGIEWKKMPEGDAISVAFSNLPKADPSMIMVIKGIKDVTKRIYSGEVFTVAMNQPVQDADRAHLLKGTLDDSKMETFEHIGSFYFAYPTVASEKPTRQVSRDPNNPCPDRPCWSNGGVGRRKQYYRAGPIQNAGRGPIVAGFARGIPAGTTREAQIAAQWVGIERSNTIYSGANRYNNFGWGFFMFM